MDAWREKWEIRTAGVCFGLIFHRICRIVVVLHSKAGSGHWCALAKAQPRRAAGEALQQTAAENSACSLPFQKDISQTREKSSSGCSPLYPGEKRWIQLKTWLCMLKSPEPGAEDQISFMSSHAKVFERWAELVFRRLSSSSFQESNRTISSTPFIKRSCKWRWDQVLYE